VAVAGGALGAGGESERGAGAAAARGGAKRRRAVQQQHELRRAERRQRACLAHRAWPAACTRILHEDMLRTAHTRRRARMRRMHACMHA
jgi:hypothetical protein